MADWKNQLFFGDNLDILRDHVATESVDLVYLDPPFNSKADYNVLYKNGSGEASVAQTIAFKDTWNWDAEAASAYHDLMTSVAVPTNVKNLMQALKVFLTGDTGQKGNSMMAYLTMMALRLVELHRVLKPTGSLYLHCDPTASHYLKLVLDAVFGFEGFKNEIVWKRSAAHSDTKQGMKRLGRISDTIFFYTMSSSYTFNPQYHAFSEDYLDSEYRHKDPKTGRYYKESDLTAAKPGGDTSFDWHVKRVVGSKERWIPDLTSEYLSPAPGWEYRAVGPYEGRFWAYSKANLVSFWKEGRMVHRETGMPRLMHFADEMQGITLQDIWTDIVKALGDERLGYPTQKPEALLERIILASSNEGDVVLDPFCGCGTTIAVAERLNRRWIGIDVTYLAVGLMERRLIDAFTPGGNIASLADIPVPKRRLALKKYWENGEDVLGIGLHTGLKPYEVLGDPKSADDARFLFQNDPYQFEWWAVDMLGAQGKEFKRGSDKGIDGLIVFQDKAGDYQRALVSVKGGGVKREMIATLKGDMQRENAVIGIMVTNEEPTGPMRREAADAGRWTSALHPERSYPVIQILTAAELLAGKDPDIPRWGLDTHRKAAKVQGPKPKQLSIDAEDD